MKINFSLSFVSGSIIRFVCFLMFLKYFLEIKLNSSIVIEIFSLLDEIFLFNPYFESVTSLLKFIFNYKKLS